MSFLLNHVLTVFFIWKLTAQIHLLDLTKFSCVVDSNTYIFLYCKELELGCPERGPAPGTPRRDPDVLGVGAGRG